MYFPHAPNAPESTSTPRLSAWAPMVLLLLGSLAAAAASSLRPRDPARLAAVFPPWWSAAQSLDAASQVAAVTGFGGFAFIVAVSGAGPDLPRRLADEGAWLVLDGSAFAFCSTRYKGPVT